MNKCMELKINQIYKVKEGHEGKCDSFTGECRYIKSISDEDIVFHYLDENKQYVREHYINCFTEDDLELEEEEVKEKSLEDLEVRRDWKKMLEDINELVDNDFGFDLQFDEKEYTDKDVDKMRKIILSTYQISHCVYCKSCQNKYKYQISKQISPSEAETLLEEKLGIKVKIK